MSRLHLLIVTLMLISGCTPPKPPSKKEKEATGVAATSMEKNSIPPPSPTSSPPTASPNSPATSNRIIPLQGLADCKIGDDVSVAMNKFGPPSKDLDFAYEFANAGVATFIDAEKKISFFFFFFQTDGFKPFDGKFENGIGFGSTRDEVIAKFGPPDSNSTGTGSTTSQASSTDKPRSISYSRLGLELYFANEKLDQVMVLQPPAQAKQAVQGNNSSESSGNGSNGLATIVPNLGLVDCKLSDPVQNALRKFGDPDSTSSGVYEFRSKGITVFTDNGRIISIVFLFREKGFQRFAGQVEGGIGYDSTPADVLKILGPADLDIAAGTKTSNPNTANLHYNDLGLNFNFAGGRLRNVILINLKK